LDDDGGGGAEGDAEDEEATSIAAASAAAAARGTEGIPPVFAGGRSVRAAVAGWLAARWLPRWRVDLLVCYWVVTGDGVGAAAAGAGSYLRWGLASAAGRFAGFGWRRPRISEGSGGGCPRPRSLPAYMRALPWFCFRVGHSGVSSVTRGGVTRLRRQAGCVRALSGGGEGFAAAAAAAAHVVQ
jgi:hypothetical protein